MKKVLIGCGILVVLLLAALGVGVYLVAPGVMDMMRQWTEAAEEMKALDQQHPFDEAAEGAFDELRFASTLDARAGVIRGIRTREAAFEEVADGDELSIRETLTEGLGVAAPMLTDLADALAAAQMGPAEFVYHTRVLWAALQRVDAGLGPPELEPLRGIYENMAKQYEASTKFDPNAKPLAEVLGEVDRAITDSAMEVMASKVSTIEEALDEVGLEPMYLSLMTSIESGQVPGGFSMDG